MPSPAEHLRDMAWECRQLAAQLHDENVRRDLLMVAERFERLAAVREHAGSAPQTDPAPSGGAKQAETC